jgi:TonB-linked SusC/RagA family outer membrane protein
MNENRIKQWNVLRKLSLIVCTCVCISPLFAQGNIKISGTITDTGGEPVIGANVVVPGTTIGTASDMDGKFTLNVPEGSSLLISYIGYVSQTVKATDNLTVVLQDEVGSLDELVVVGYGVQKKRDLTGSISSIKLDDAPVATFSTISHALAGKASGLRVTQNSAQVGGGAKFRIRGETSTGAGNEPLIIIDGFPVTSSSSDLSGNYSAGSTDNLLESINPNDIESIEILKDASSTAIFGSRAGHGVIIVTTKRGKEGHTKVNYSGNFSVQNMKNGYDILDAQEFMQHRNAVDYEEFLQVNWQDVYAGYAAANNGTPKPNATFTPTYSDAQIANAKTTDYFNEITRTGLQQSHNVSMTGGSNGTQYMASINYFDQKGVIKNNGMSRLTANINLDKQVSKYVKTGLSFNLSRNQYDNVSLGDNENEYSGVLVSAVRFVPYYPVRDANGDYSQSTEMAQVPNPVALLDMVDKTTKDRLLGSAYLQVEPVKDLILKAMLGVDRKYAKRKSYKPATTRKGFTSSAIIDQEDKSDYLMDLTANYSKTFGDHSLSVLAGYSYQQFNTEGVYADNTDFPIDGFLYNNLGMGAGAKPGVGSWAEKSVLASYFGRLNYSFLGRYLLTATFRSDADSDFAPDFRWGYFPSTSIGWRFSDEPFLESITNILSNGKLRTGYGQTGNSNVGNRIKDAYGSGDSYVFGETSVKGVKVIRLGNPKLTWETTSEFNLGLDLGFLHNRISVSADYYDRIISDLLRTDYPLLSYNENTTIAANIGKTRGQGFELTLNTVNITSRDLFWSTDLTFSTYKDRWEERASDWKPAAYQSEKDPIRALFRYQSDGLMTVGETAPAWMPTLLPGQIKLKNLKDETDSPNILDQYDRVLLGSEDPAFTFGFNNTLRYKSFDFNIYFYGEVNRWRGASYYNSWVSTHTHNVENVSKGSLTSWLHNQQNTTQPSVIASNYATIVNNSDYWYKKISYVRCRNITLGYTVPVPQKILNSVRVYADVNNPFVITNWNGVDPETDNDKYAYPNVTSFSLGVDISF